MAYHYDNQYQQPQRPGYDEYYSSEPRAQPPGGRMPPRSISHSTSQPQGLNGQYAHDARGTKMDPEAVRAQSQRRPLPAPDGHRPNPAVHGLEDGMRDMQLGASGPLPLPGDQMGLLRGGGLIRGDPQMYGGGIRGVPRRLPTMGYEIGRGGSLQQQQRMPPPRGAFVLANGGGGEYISSGRPPVRHNSTHDQGWNNTQYQQYGGAYQAEPEPIMGIQRSQTMPTSVTQPQYMAYNPARHATPAPVAELRAQDPAYGIGVRRVLEPQWPRESVGAVLDAYCQEPEYYDDSMADYANPNAYQYSQTAHVEQKANLNFSRPVVQPQEWNGKASELAKPAPCRHSQSNLQDGYGVPAPYDGVAEMPAEVPPPPAVNGYISQSRSNVPSALRLGSPAPPSIKSPTRLTSSQRRPSIQEGLPVHPSPSDLPEAEAATQYLNPDALPPHPPHIRPGLLQEPTPGHPPPVRQYDTDRSHSSPQNIAEGPVTVQELEQLQTAAKLNSSDQQIHLTLAKKMVEAASILASDGGRADIKTTRRNRENYIFDAHKIIKKLTGSSHPYPDAMFYLASCYGEGQLGLQVDHERAFNLYQSAAKLNHAPSAYRTAVCCELGAGVRKDPQRAMTWYRKAASLGETPAMFKLGMILWKGLLGQPRNPRDGLIWLKRAADQADENNQHALHELGLLYESDGGDVEIPDLNYAQELFLRAADLGYAASQFRMGCAYEYGTIGCPVDPRKSIAWYSKAAMKGDHEAQLALSGWYLTGAEGIIQQSDTEAYLWARKAAEKGLAKAEYALGYYTEVGIGVAANLDEAKRWYYKAASQQHPKAQLRLQELKKGGLPGVQKSRERLSRFNVKQKDEGDCVMM